MRKLIKGENDLESWAKLYNKDILDEWDYNKNINELGLSIDKVHYSSHKKAYFKCKYCGEVSLCNISDRTLKRSRCGKCANANQTSYPEQLIYNICKEIESTSISQYELDGYKYDIGIEKLKLCIEYNSFWTHGHYGNGTETKKKDICDNNGFTLITICDSSDTNEILYDNINLIYYYKESSNKLINLYKICKSIFYSYGYNINISNNRLYEIDSIAKNKSLNRKDVAVSLLDKVPNIIYEWDYEKNNGVKPEEVTYGSTVKYWFKCSKGHSYLAAPKHKSSKNPTGCKRCQDTRVRKSKKLVTDYPSLAIEYDLDNEIDIHNITYGYTSSVRWTCPNCGYKFSTSPNSRTYGKYGCKRCGYNWYKLINREPQKIKYPYKFDIARVKEIYYERKSTSNVE